MRCALDASTWLCMWTSCVGLVWRDTEEVGDPCRYDINKYVVDLKMKDGVLVNEVEGSYVGPQIKVFMDGVSLRLRYGDCGLSLLVT